MIVHKVKKGDTLWSLALKYLGNGSRYKEIMRANGLKDTVINIGDTLEIPSDKPSKPNYEKLGKAFEKALNDVENLPSVNALYDMMEDSQ